MDPMIDPVRDLNNFLQGQPGGSLTKEFKWLSKREGPDHGAVYHVTAVCKSPFFLSDQLFFTPCTTVRGVNVGIGHGSSVGSAKRQASMQALEYLKTHGNGPTTTVIRIVLTGKLSTRSTSLNATVQAVQVIPGLRRSVIH
jgi:dsRNA-specific ribonuclease